MNNFAESSIKKRIHVIVEKKCLNNLFLLGPVVKCQFLIGWQRLKIKSEGKIFLKRKAFVMLTFLQIT